MNSQTVYDSIVVGAGLAGLAVATRLSEAGQSVLMLERSDRIGGRLRTDTLDGFQCDRGFQVLLTSYAACRRLLDYESLRLGRFEPGALLWNGSRFDLVADPLRKPGLALKTLRSKSGTLLDKLRIAKMAIELRFSSIGSIYEKPEFSSLESLRRRGFSEGMIALFLRPFFSGIFLEPDLASSSRMLEFVFKRFGSGYAALPAGGMADIPRQLAERIPSKLIRLGYEVDSVSGTSVRTASGESYQARNVILATDMKAASQLVGEIADRGHNGTRCYYFKANQSPLPRPMIALNASGEGAIQNLCVPSDISPSYAPEGKSLICVTISMNSAKERAQIEEELRNWFGQEAESFEFLKSYDIPYSLPRQSPGDLAFGDAPLRSAEGLWICGDYRFSSSIEGALRSGIQVAEAILEG
ncbi:MAG: NAD(P)/FAD-dependent oxidoreductase [Verrucomicrobiota bacterium]